MHDWKEIRSDADINLLLSDFGGFHDSCLVELYYRSGSYVDQNNAMIFGPSEDHELHMIFHSQWYKQPLELCFNGVRKCCFAGFQQTYFCEILDCHLAIHTNLINHIDTPLIVWADWAGFSPKDFAEDELILEPISTYVIAEKLKWRFLNHHKNRNVISN